LRQRAEELIIEKRTLIGFDEVLRELETLKEMVSEKAIQPEEDATWIDVLKSIIEAEAFFAIGEVWKTLVLAQENKKMNNQSNPARAADVR